MTPEVAGREAAQCMIEDAAFEKRAIAAIDYSDETIGHSFEMFSYNRGWGADAFTAFRAAFLARIASR